MNGALFGEPRHGLAVRRWARVNSGDFSHIPRARAVVALFRHLLALERGLQRAWERDAALPLKCQRGEAVIN